MRKDVEEKRIRIVTILKEKGPLGLSGLVNETRYDKKTVIKYGIIQKKGKFAKYSLTSNAYQYPAIKGGIFQMEVIGEIFSPSRNRIYPHKGNVNYKETLSKFGSDIASFIIYSFIQSLAPEAWNLKIDDMPLAEKTQGSDKDSAVEIWINNCIRPFQLFVEFCKLPTINEGLPWGVALRPPDFHIFVERMKSSSENLDREQVKNLEKNAVNVWNRLKKSYEKNKVKNFNSSKPRFELNKHVYNNLVKAFKDLYPDNYEKLEKIRIESIDEIKRQISLSKDPRHDKCKGERISIKKGRFENMEQCTECKRYFSNFENI
jgi:hypothetical protein